MSYNAYSKQIYNSLTGNSAFKFSENQYHFIKIDHRRSGSRCQTKLYIDFKELKATTNNCGSYSASETVVFASKDYNGKSATGRVDSFRFVWLWITDSKFPSMRLVYRSLLTWAAWQAFFDITKTWILLTLLSFFSLTSKFSYVNFYVSA